MSEKNPSHVPWWQKKKYRYHQRDCIMGTKVRPGTKLKKMHPDCQHVLTEVNYRRMYQTKAKYGYIFITIKCPVCRRPIPGDFVSSSIRLF